MPDSEIDMMAFFNDAKFEQLLQKAVLWKRKPEVFAAMILKGVDLAASYVDDLLEELDGKPTGENIIDAVAGFYHIPRDMAAQAIRNRLKYYFLDMEKPIMLPAASPDLPADHVDWLKGRDRFAVERRTTKQRRNMLVPLREGEGEKKPPFRVAMGSRTLHLRNIKKITDTDVAIAEGWVRQIQKLEEEGVGTPPKINAKADFRVFKDGHNSSKFGDHITAAPYTNYRFYYADVEERKTCSRSCHVYSICFGNNTPEATRHVVDDNYLRLLRLEIAALAWKFPQGVMLRAHELGDFVSVDHAKAWIEEAIKHPNVALWITTARHPGCNPEAYMDFNGKLSDEERQLNIEIGNYLLTQSFLHPRQVRLTFSTPVPNIPGTMSAAVDMSASLPQIKPLEVERALPHAPDVVTSRVCSMHRKKFQVDPAYFDKSQGGLSADDAGKLRKSLETLEGLSCTTCGLCWKAAANYLGSSGGHSITLHEHGASIAMVIDLDKFRVNRKMHGKKQIIPRLSKPPRPDHSSEPS